MKKNWKRLCLVMLSCILGFMAIWMVYPGSDSVPSIASTPAKVGQTPDLDREPETRSQTPQSKPIPTTSFTQDPPISDLEEAMRAILPHTPLGWVRCKIPAHLAHADISGLDRYASVYTKSETEVIVSMGVVDPVGALVLTQPYEKPKLKMPTEDLSAPPDPNQTPMDTFDQQTDEVEGKMDAIVDYMDQKTRLKDENLIGQMVWRDAYPGKKGTCTFVERGESEQMTVTVKVVDTEGNPLQGATVSPKTSDFSPGQDLVDKTDVNGITYIKAPAEEPLRLEAKYRWVNGYRNAISIIPSQTRLAVLTLDMTQEPDVLTRSSGVDLWLEHKEPRAEEMESALLNESLSDQTRAIIEEWLAEIHDEIDERMERERERAAIREAKYAEETRRLEAAVERQRDQSEEE